VGIFFLAAWALSVPILSIAALVLWFKRLRAELPLWRSAVGVATLFVLLGNWVWFLWLACVGEIGGFGTHFLTTRSADEYLLIPLAAIVTSVALKSKSRALAVVASFLMFALWGGSEMVA